MSCWKEASRKVKVWDVSNEEFLGICIAMVVMDGYSIERDCFTCFMQLGWIGGKLGKIHECLTTTISI